MCEWCCKNPWTRWIRWEEKYKTGPSAWGQGPVRRCACVSPGCAMSFIGLWDFWQPENQTNLRAHAVFAPADFFANWSCMPTLTLRQIHMNQCEPECTFQDPLLNEARCKSNRADKWDRMAPSETVWSGTVSLIQRWMHAGYNSHNLIEAFIPTVRPGEHQSLKIQHLDSAQLLTAFNFTWTWMPESPPVNWFKL